MTHRYNTRFQANKKSIDANKASDTIKPTTWQLFKSREELLACNMPTPNEMPDNGNIKKMTPEVANIKTMLDEVEANKENSFNKTLIALRIFHYLEHHHQTLKEHRNFREVVLAKAKEFIEVAKEKKLLLSSCSPTCVGYQAASYLASVTAELERSCTIVMSHIEKM